MKTTLHSAFTALAWLALSVLVAGLFPVQNATAATVTATTSDDGFPAHLVTWLDSSGNTRSAMMIDQNSTGGGPYTGYLRQYRYYVGETQRICTGFYSVADGGGLEFSGDGFVENHTASDGDWSSGNGVGTGNDQGQTPGTTAVTNFGNHVIIEYDMPNYAISGPYYNPVTSYSVPTTIQWFFADGRDHPIFAISQDAHLSSGNLGADSRSPYGDMAYDGFETYIAENPTANDNGCGNDGNLNNVGGASYGDTWKFVTTPDNGFLTPNSAWTDEVANTIPYAMQWAQDDTYTPPEGEGSPVPGVDAEWGHVATLPGSVYDQGEDPTSDPSTDPRDSSGASMIPDETWAFQIMAYVWAYENGGATTDPTQEKRLTWGRNYGSVGGYDGGNGGGNVDPLNYYPHWNDPLGHNNSSPTRRDGSLMAYSVFDVFGVHNGGYLNGVVAQQVTQMENVALATLSIPNGTGIGTVVTSGPAGVGNTAYAQSKTITYSPPGYNPTYSVWEITSSANEVNAKLTPAVNKPLASPIFLIDNYTLSSLPTSISVNGSAASSGYYASVDTVNQRLWITVNISSITSASPLTLIVTAPAGPPPAPTISSFAPTNGHSGTQVTISGQNFGTTFSGEGATTVAFNGASATISIGSATSITASVPSSASTGPITVSVPGSGTATSATSFTKLYLLTMTANPPSDGTVSATGTPTSEFVQEYFPAGPNTMVAIANPGYIFVNWTSNSAPVSSSASFPIQFNSDAVYDANFAVAFTYTNIASPADGGTVSPSGTNATNSSITVTATNNPGYVFAGWTSNGVAVANATTNYTFTLSTNFTNIATFELTPPQIVVLNGINVVTNNQSFNFGSAKQNATGSNVTFTVTNSGGMTLNLGIASVPPGFIVTQNPNPLGTLAYGASNTFSVQLNTATNGVYSGDITITNNGANNGSFTIAVAGTVANSPPQIVVLNGTNVMANNQAFNFGSAQLNATGSNITFTVTNAGGTTLAVGIASVPSGFIVTQNPNPLGTLAYGASNTFSVQLNTATNGVYSGDITITNNSANNSTFTIAVAGTVVNPTPQIAVFNGINAIANGQSSPVNFGSVQQNQPGPILTFTVTNSGGQTLDLGTPTLPPGYAFVAHPPATIPANGSGTFSLQLDTATVGAYSGNITITNNANSLFVFPITGVVNGKIISLSGNLAFGGVALGASSNLTFTISNSGNAILTVSSISYPVTALSGAWSGIIAAGASQAVPVTFSPTIASNYSGMVTVNSDATSGANMIPASGYGKNGALVLTININGPGSVTPNLNGKTLVSGSKHKITATPTLGSGEIFAGWTGSINTNKNPFTFTMEPSTVLQANFIFNPFPPYAGIYNGLFIDANNIVAEETAGLLKTLSVNSQGAYNGTLFINGTNHVIDGIFDPTSTQATNTFASEGSEGELTVVMTLGYSSNSLPQLTGTVSGSTNGTAWQANLLADLATNLHSAAYTMLILPDTNNTPPNLPPNVAPGGDGYASISYSPAETNIKITGALADGSSLDQTETVSQDGYAPIYANLYGGKGLLLGWINLFSTNAAGIGLTWIHPVTQSGLYKKGFTNNLLAGQILLSPWTNSPDNTALTNLSILDTINDTTPLTSIPVKTTAAGKVSGAHVSGTINHTNGILTVTFPNGTVGHGAVLLNQANAGGYILTKTNAQAIQLTP